MNISVRQLIEGEAEGEIVKVETPLSLWGGFDPASGKVIERSHASFGAVLTGRVLIMPTGRGSSSASSILAEAIRLGSGPVGIVLSEPDPILAVGAIVARRLYGKSIPIVVCEPPDFDHLPKTGRARIIAGAEGPPRVQLAPYR